MKTTEPQPSVAAATEGGDPAFAGEPGEGIPTGYFRSSRF
jgi:hypothetical protein